MCENNKVEHHEGKILENQYNRLCTRYYLYRTTLYTGDLSPHKNSLPGSPLSRQGTVENTRLGTLPI